MTFRPARVAPICCIFMLIAVVFSSLFRFLWPLRNIPHLR